MHCAVRGRRIATKTSRYTTRNHVDSSINRDGFNAIIARSGADSPLYQDDDRAQDGRFGGKSIAVKDNIVTSDLPTAAASNILSNHKSPFEATVVKLLRRHGASITTKTNLDEFGMGSHSQTSYHEPVVSCYKRNGSLLSPGGSSGGSAVAVATGDSWAALGTDTGGSVRLPAAFMGIVGYKPSYGLLSRWGVIQYANSLDTVGVLTQSVRDASALFGALSQHDTQDPTSLSPFLRERISRQGSQANPASLRVGIPLEYNILELSPSVRRTYISTLHTLQRAGHTLVPISLPTTAQALSAYYVLAPAEASSNLAKYDGIRYGHRTSGSDASPSENSPLYAKTRGEGFGAEVQRRILLGAYTLSSAARDNYFLQAQKVRRVVQRDFDRVFARKNPLLDHSDEEMGDFVPGKVDILLTPTAPTLPPTVEEVKLLSPVENYMNDVFTVPASLAGLPCASVPAALPDDVRESMEECDVRSVGMQIVAQFGDDELVLTAAEIVEELMK